MNFLPRRHKEMLCVFVGETYLTGELFSTDFSTKDINRRESRNLFR
jgi:hypothetical protein